MMVFIVIKRKCYQLAIYKYQTKFFISLKPLFDPPPHFFICPNFTFSLSKISFTSNINSELLEWSAPQGTWIRQFSTGNILDATTAFPMLAMNVKVNILSFASNMRRSASQRSGASRSKASCYWWGRDWKLAMKMWSDWKLNVNGVIYYWSWM